MESDGIRILNLNYLKARSSAQGANYISNISFACPTFSRGEFRSDILHFSAMFLREMLRHASEWGALGN